MSLVYNLDSLYIRCLYGSIFCSTIWFEVTLFRRMGSFCLSSWSYLTTEYQMPVFFFFFLSSRVCHTICPRFVIVLKWKCIEIKASEKLAGLYLWENCSFEMLPFCQSEIILMFSFQEHTFQLLYVFSLKEADSLGGNPKCFCWHSIVCYFRRAIIGSSVC